MCKRHTTCHHEPLHISLSNNTQNETFVLLSRNGNASTRSLHIRFVQHSHHFGAHHWDLLHPIYRKVQKVWGIAAGYKHQEPVDRCASDKWTTHVCDRFAQGTCARTHSI